MCAHVEQYIGSISIFYCNHDCLSTILLVCFRTAAEKRRLSCLNLLKFKLYPSRNTSNLNTWLFSSRSKHYSLRNQRKMSIQDPFPLPGGSVLFLHSRFVEIHSVVLVKSCWKKHSNIFVAEYIFKYIYRWHFLRVLYSLKGENAIVTLFIDTNKENKIES